MSAQFLLDVSGQRVGEFGVQVAPGTLGGGARDALGDALFYRRPQKRLCWTFGWLQRGQSKWRRWLAE